MSRPLVLYHGPGCPDGFCAAFIAWLHLQDGADYQPVQYGSEASLSLDPPDATGRPVYVLDFSYPRDALLALAARAESVLVLDHHKTAAAELAGLEAPNLTIAFDMQKSGARLAHEHFNPGQLVPWLVDYTEDRDLWRWRLPWSRAVSAAIASYPHDFARWSTWAVFSEPPEHLVNEGVAILRYQDQQLKALCATAREVEIGGHRVLAANTPVLISEVAGRLAEGLPFGAAWFRRSDGKIQWSLRSTREGVDVAEVARTKGGGGHKNAAGFEEVG